MGCNREEMCDGILKLLLKFNVCKIDFDGITKEEFVIKDEKPHLYIVCCK